MATHRTAGPDISFYLAVYLFNVHGSVVKNCNLLPSFIVIWGEFCIYCTRYMSAKT